MTPADRAALAARLRRDAYSQDDVYIAAADLERPRPRVEWLRYEDGSVVARAPAMEARLRDAPTYRDWLEAYRADLLAAGFDVAPLPEVDRG